MKITNTFLLLAALSKSANAVELDICVSEATWGLTNCVLETCAVQADKCLYTTAQDDSCAQFETSCVGLMDECCGGGCKTAAATLLDCAMQDVCPPFACGATATRQLGFRNLEELGNMSCMSEATAAYTKCLINNCPGADAACTGMAPDADNCADVAAFCPTINSCCPACQASLEALLGCTTGDICGDFDCATGTVAGLQSTGTTDSGTNGGTTSNGGTTDSSAMAYDMMAALGATMTMYLFLA